jgi:exosortase
MTTKKATKNSQRSSRFSLNWRSLRRHLHNQLKRSVATTQNRIITLGLLVGLCYLPVWLDLIGVLAGTRSTAFFLLMVVCLGFYELWKSRPQLNQLVASEEDRLLGYVLILSGVLAFPFCRFDVWPQAIIWTIVAAGVACSLWGAAFFKKHLTIALLFLLSVYPQPGIISRLLWEFLTPPYFLENFMAWAGGTAFQAVGQVATIEGRFLYLSKGSVEVAWGCNGFSMALNTAGAGLLMGLFFKLPWHKVFALIASGIVLALIFNVPRIMLLAVAAVYWGKDSFEFWHGPIGGQIFSTLLLTAYYYAVMGIINQKLQKGNV